MLVWPGEVTESVLFVGVIAGAVVSMPLVRFNDDLYGDEPKYVSYCEDLVSGSRLPRPITID